MRITDIIMLSLLVFMPPVEVHAQAEGKSTLILDFPLIDLPYQLRAADAKGNFITGYIHPGMPQSLALSNNLVTSVHYGIGRIVQIDEGWIDFLVENTLATGFYFLQSGLPFGIVWLHEEYHKAVLARYGMDSFNEVYTFPFFKDMIKVSHVKDENLIHLSDNKPADFVRLNAAGAEAQIHQVMTLQAYSFYYDQSLPNLPFYWLSIFNNFAYIFSCTQNEDWEENINELNAKEVHIKDRDFTGPDFTAWVYKLFRPNVSYQSRGTHPSGTGIDRYIRPSQLTSEEKEYLAGVAFKHLLNFVSPFMVGIRKIRISSLSGDEHVFNFALRHVLTSFGESICLDLYYQGMGYNLMVSPHIYQNYTTTFFGLELALIDKPIFSHALRISGRLMVWTQPEAQSFTTSEPRVGGLMGIKLAYKTGIWEPYLEWEAKSRGWVIGNVFLDENFSGRVGLVIRLP